MKFTILGSGGAMPTPRPFCNCELCNKARTLGEPYKRNGSAFYLHDIKALVDCGEDIVESLNKRNISDVDYLFITHRHPDHTFGMRNVLQSYFDFLENKKRKTITLYMPKSVHEALKIHYPAIVYFTEVLGLATIVYLEHNESVVLHDIKITAVGFTGKASETYGYLFEKNNKKCLYTPCDTISFQQEMNDIDVLVTECGVFSHDKVKSEISFPALMDKLRIWKPKSIVLTHIEEIELHRRGREYMEEMKQKYKDIPITFAYDGLDIHL